MNLSRRSSSNNLVRQVLREIISDPPTSSRKSAQLQQVKLNQAVAYLQKKIERQQSEIKVLSEQLGREIETKEQLISLLNQERQKNTRLTQHLANSNKSASETKKRLAKFEGFQSKEAKLKQDYELKLAKCKDMLRKKDDQLSKALTKIQEFQIGSANISQIEKQLKQLRQKVLAMGQREISLIKQVQEAQDILIAKQQAILFSEEHLRRLKQEYEDFEQDQYKSQIQTRQLQTQMKQLLQKQNQQIKKLNEKIVAKSNETCQNCKNFEKFHSNSSFIFQKPQWELSVFKSQLKKAINSSVRDVVIKQKLQSDILVIFEAIESSFNGILSQVMSQI